jgi:hypothetical protein
LSTRSGAHVFSHKTTGYRPITTGSVRILTTGGNDLPSATRARIETATMADDTTKQQQFWIGIVAVIILLIFLYFYRPFETYLVAHIPFIHFSNVVFWFASLVGIVAYAFAHWQSFRTEIFRNVTELNVDTLVFDTLQAAVLAAVIFCAGATLQAIEVLSEYFVNRGPIIDAAFGEKLLAIFLLVILAVIFYLLHYVVRALRTGWRPRSAPPRAR